MKLLKLAKLMASMSNFYPGIVANALCTYKISISLCIDATPRFPELSIIARLVETEFAVIAFQNLSLAKVTITSR